MCSETICLEKTSNLAVKSSSYFRVFWLSLYMFDEENFISLASFCPSTYVYPNPASHEPANYKKESFKWIEFFREIFVFFFSHNSVFFSRNVYIIFFRIFSRNFHSSHFAKNAKRFIFLAWNYPNRTSNSLTNVIRKRFKEYRYEIVSHLIIRVQSLYRDSSPRYKLILYKELDGVENILCI